MMNTSKHANASRWMRTALLAVLATVAAGCNNDEIDAGNNRDKQKAKMTIHVSTGQKAPGTRVAYDDDKVDTGEGKTLTWQAGDQLTVVRMNAGKIMTSQSDYTYQGEDGATSGTFEGTEITTAGDSWAVYYPNKVDVNLDENTVTLPMTGQTQTANNNTEHLRYHLLLQATGLPNLTDGFALKMKSSIMKFELSGIPAEVGELKELTWMAETATDRRSIPLSFAQGAVNFGPGGNNSSGTLTAYMSFMPEEMSVKQGGQFTVILRGDKTYRAVTTVTDGKSYEAGKRYTAEIEQSGINWHEIDIMALTVKVDKSSLGFNIPFPTGSSTPANVNASADDATPADATPPVDTTTPANITVNWGDGNEVTVAKGTPLSDSDGFNHMYAKEGTYTVTIISDQTDVTQQQIPEFNFKKNRDANSNALRVISINTPLLNTGTTNLSRCFYTCDALESIPEGLFDKNTQATDFSFCFGYCNILQSIPKGLFDKNTQATHFKSCFAGCNALQSIPEGLFDKNTEATSFFGCFGGCTNLVLNEKIFSADGAKDRFAGKQMDFTSCFENAGTNLEDAGTAPDLWNYEKGGKAWASTDCFKAAQKLSNWPEISTDWGGEKVDKTTMELTVTVKVATGLSFNIPFPTSGQTPAKITVAWGDGNETVVEAETQLSESDGFKHNYATQGTYTITISSAQTNEALQQIPAFNFNSYRKGDSNASKLISVNTPLLNTDSESFDSCFLGCTALQSIPEGLFDKNTKATTFADCFSQCAALTSIPQGLFDKHTEATNFYGCFADCAALQRVPEGLFDKNMKATTFRLCFSGCTKLSLNETTFSTNKDSKRFAGKQMDFTSCFENAGSGLANSGTAPCLWNYERDKTWGTANCFTGAKKLSNWGEIPTDWGGEKVDKATMKLTVEVGKSTGMDFNIPFSTSGQTPAKITVVWGDGNETVVEAGTQLSESDGFKHTYGAQGKYTITISSAQTNEALQQIPAFNFGNNRNSDNNPAKLISVDTPLLNTMATDFSKCFEGCTALESISEGLFDKNTKVTDFTSCFFKCTTLQSIPEGLFAKNTQVQKFSFCFAQCHALKSIPDGLFDTNTLATDFYSCFHTCKALESVPEGLFAQNTQATQFTSCFYDCAQLALNTKIFSTTARPYSRFYGKKMIFENCFYNAGSALASQPAGAAAPDLWNYERDGEPWGIANCFKNTNQKLSNWGEIPTEWGGDKVYDVMKLTIKVDNSSGLGFNIPFATSGTTPATLNVNWGDGNQTVVASGATLSATDRFNHTYAAGNTYTIAISSAQTDEKQKQIPGFNFYRNKNNNYSNCLKLIKVDTPLLNTGETDFSSCFSGCTALQSIPSGLFDKNKGVTIFRGCFDYCKTLQSIPSGLFDNNKGATNFDFCFGSCETLRSIPEGLFNENTEVTYFDYCFYNCTALQSIPPGLFDNNGKVTTFAHCFVNCFALKSIPSGLFKNNRAATDFPQCFADCTALQSIPSGLFDNNRAATNFEQCFARCTALQKIPSGLFNNNTTATNFEQCFVDCPHLVLHNNIFSTNGTKTRFSGKEMNFMGCFMRVGTALTSSETSIAPELWKYETGGKTWKTEDCFWKAKNQLSNWLSIPNSWGGNRAEMQLTIKVTDKNYSLLDFYLPFPTTGTVPAKMAVDWGDGNESVIARGTTLSLKDGFFHTYTKEGEYTITICSEETDEKKQQMPAFSMRNNRPDAGQNMSRLIRVDTPLLNTKQTSLESAFSFCVNLQSIPSGLFDKNTEATSFNQCFLSCRNLENVPEGLFDKHKEATNFSGCFADCDKLPLNKKIFSRTEDRKRFSGKEMNFERCFARIGTKLTSGATSTAPELWLYDKGGKTWNSTACFEDASNKFSNWTSIPQDWIK